MPAHPMSDALCAETLELWEKHSRNAQHAADASGIPYPTFKSRLRLARSRLSEDSVKGNADGYGYRDRQPDPFVIKGTSTLYGVNDEGERVEKLQWVKTKLDDELRAQLIREAFEGWADRVPAYEPAPPSVFLLNGSLLNFVTITDAHIGMLAWGKESGHDWDLPIAKRLLITAFCDMIDRMPRAQKCVINQQGDFLHYDSMRSETPEHKNMLDADGRPQKMIDYAVDILDAIVQHALRTHQEVELICAEGNHDPFGGGVWLPILFKKLYRAEPRLKVNDSALPHYVTQWGQVMLAITHGHLKKPAAAPLMFASQFPQMWGSTVHRYGHSGHEHHLEVKEMSGMTWTMHSTLAARDAYAARGGWMTDRQATGMTYHKRYGLFSSTTVVPEMYDEQEAEIFEA